MVAGVVMESGAIISLCGQFRSRLWRIWDTELPRVLWVMLNPSTADENVNDPTIEAIIDFTQRWGFGGIEVCNAYAYRTKSPALLKAARYPIGPDNDRTLQAMMGAISEENGIVMAAWGAHIQAGRAHSIRTDAMLCSTPLYHLGLNKNGSPKHPLYIRRDTPRREWFS